MYTSIDIILSTLIYAYIQVLNSASWPSVISSQVNYALSLKLKLVIVGQIAVIAYDIACTYTCIKNYIIVKI